MITVLLGSIWRHVRTNKTKFKNNKIFIRALKTLQNTQKMTWWGTGFKLVVLGFFLILLIVFILAPWYKNNCIANHMDKHLMDAQNDKPGRKETEPDIKIQEQNINQTESQITKNWTEGYDSDDD